MRNIDYINLENDIIQLIANTEMPVAVACLIIDKISNNFKAQLNNAIMYEQMQDRKQQEETQNNEMQNNEIQNNEKIEE